MPDGQSAPVLQPCSQTWSGRQYSPIGQLSPAPGRQATQVLVCVSQRGVAPPQLESSRHCTHWFVCGLHSRPLGQGWFALQPGVQVWLLLQTKPGWHWLSIRQPTQVFELGSQMGCAGSWQSASATHSTQFCEPGLQTGICGLVQSVPVRQVTQRP